MFPGTLSLLVSVASCCSSCCCGSSSSTSEAKPQEPAEQPPRLLEAAPSQEPSDKPPPPKDAAPTEVTPGSRSVIRALVTAGVAADPLTWSPADQHARQRIEALQAAVARGAPVERALTEVYGDRWLSHPAKSEVIAILYRENPSFRAKLQALMGADVVMDWLGESEVQMAVTLRATLSRVLPLSPDEIPVSSGTSQLRYTLKRGGEVDHRFRDTGMKFYEWEQNIVLYDADGTLLFQNRERLLGPGVTEERALQSLLERKVNPALSGDRIVGRVVDQFLQEVNTQLWADMRGRAFEADTTVAPY